MRALCVRTHTNTTFCIAWLNPPTEEGLSAKRVGYLTKFDTFQSILVIRLSWYITVWLALIFPRHSDLVRWDNPGSI